MADFSVNSAGIIEICKSAAMRSALQSAADSIAAKANAEASNLIPSLQEYAHQDLTKMRNPNYFSGVDELSRTCVGAVWTGNTVGMMAQNVYKTLEKQVV